MNPLQRQQQRRTAVAVCLGLLLFALLCLLGVAVFRLVVPAKSKTGANFSVSRLKSSVDANQNGRDDYEDFLRGARKDAEKHPAYDGRYFSGGYPPEEIGVCTDTVWRAFREAGYALREMVDEDIRTHAADYPEVTERDKNIDFRRVRNLRIYFDHVAEKLTTDLNRIDQWQPGDLVVFVNDSHIGIVSDRRNDRGQPYIIHNAGQPNREEDYLPHAVVKAHYRFDASKIPAEKLILWNNAGA